MNKNNRKNKTALNISILMGLLIVLACGSKDNHTGKNGDSQNEKIASDSLVIEMAGVSGKSVFEITRDQYDIVYVESSIGIFVKAIKSTPSTRDFAWIFSVNDSFVPVGSNDYITNDTDVIKWHYRKF